MRLFFSVIYFKRLNCSQVVFRLICLIVNTYISCQLSVEIVIPIMRLSVDYPGIHCEIFLIFWRKKCSTFYFLGIEKSFFCLLMHNIDMFCYELYLFLRKLTVSISTIHVCQKYLHAFVFYYWERFIGSLPGCESISWKVVP